MTHFMVGNIRLDAELIETFEIRSPRELVVRMAWGEEVSLADDAAQAFVDFLSDLDSGAPGQAGPDLEPATISGWGSMPAWESGLAAPARMRA